VYCLQNLWTLICVQSQSHTNMFVLHYFSFHCLPTFSIPKIVLNHISMCMCTFFSPPHIQVHKHVHNPRKRSQGSLVSIVTRLQAGWLGLNSQQGKGRDYFLFTHTHKPALKTIQSPVQWVPGALSLGVKWPWAEALPPLPNILGDFKWCYQLHKFIGKNCSHHL
jgi:hypothetical protein